MNRRKFIKNSVIPGAVAVTGAVKGVSVFGNNYTKEGKKMKILVITGSPRKNGNSNTLVDNFIKGAQEKGHTVVRFDSAFKNVHPCIACNKCGMGGDCVFKDDFYSVRNDIIDSNMVVFATPMYCFGISAQLKAVIDRFYSINDKIHKPKKTALFLTYTDNSRIKEQPVKKHYEVLTDYLGRTSVGEIIAPGVWTEGSIKNTPYPQKAYESGKSL